VSVSELAGLAAAASVLAAAAGVRSAGAPSPAVVALPSRAASATSVLEGSSLPPGHRARKRRLGEVERAVPQLLDLLAAGSRAGLSAELALRQAVGASRGPLAEDLSELLERADLGARWRSELGEYAASVGSRDLRRTVAVIERTETLGSSLAEATAELAASVRQARRARTLERARTAPVKMLFPLVFLILPAFLLLTVVPVLLTTVRAIS
jgi:tight adherence protein C